MIFWIVIILINGLFLGVAIDRYRSDQLPLWVLVIISIAAASVVFVSTTSILNVVTVGV